jgi:hypothetical protein
MGRFNQFIHKQKPEKMVEKTRFEKHIKPSLNESEKLNSKDKAMIKTIIRLPRNHTAVLDSFAENYADYEREIDVQWSAGKGRIMFEYNADHYELTNYLVDLCDEMGLRFESDKERFVNTQYFTIYKDKKEKK